MQEPNIELWRQRRDKTTTDAISCLIADYQVSDYANDVSRMRESVWEVALDWLARGLPMGLIAGDNVAGYRPPTDGQ